MSIKVNWSAKVNWPAVGSAAAIVAAIFTGWEASEAWRANSKSDESITVSVDRDFLPSSATLDVVPAVSNEPFSLTDKWFVEIYNLSSSPITIRRVGLMGYSDEASIMRSKRGPDGRIAQIEPFSIPAGDHRRLEVDISIPLPRAVNKIVASCNCSSFEEYREYMKNKGMDELGNFENFDTHGFPVGFDSQHPPKNAGVLVSVESATGEYYLGFGNWYPGLDRPKLPQLPHR